MKESIGHQSSRSQRMLVRVFLLSLSFLELTFDAVIGNRERCLQAGMDDHITSAYHLLLAILNLFSLCRVTEAR